MSRYEAGKRSASWLKVKSITSADFVIGGYTQGKGTRSPLGALLVGYWDGGKLVYASHLGSGFNDASLSDVRRQLEPLQRKTNPFSTKPELNAPTTWVAPELVAEVKFQDWTEDGHLRAPVFLRLRDDIDPKTVRREVAAKSVPAPGSATRGKSKRSAPSATGGSTAKKSANSEIDDVLQQLENAKTTFSIAVGPHTLKLTHLDRVYWPADQALSQAPVTKRDLLRYFAQVSPFILPHLADRPLTMIRMPDGIHGQRFFQKHWEQERPPLLARSPCSRSTRMRATSICYATTCRPCCGLRSRERSSFMSGIRARSRGRTPKRRPMTMRARRKRWRHRC